MKQNKFWFISILFILFLSYYSSNKYKILWLKNFNIFLIIILTVVYGVINYKKLPKKIRALIIKIIFLMMFISKYYLGFYLILISKGIGRRRRIFYFFIISTFFYLFTILLDQINPISDLQFLRGVSNTIIVRKDLGFGHPNTAMAALLPIFFSIYYLWYEKNKLKVIIFILVISQIVYNLTNSRTSYFLVFIFIFFILLKNKYLYKLRYIFYSEVFFLLYFSLILPSRLKDTIYNRLVSRRFWFYDYYLTNYKITLLGDKNIEKVYELLPLDNTYIRVLLEHGIIGLLILIGLIIYIFKLLYKYNDYKAIRIFSIILIFGIMEGQAFYFYFNIIYLLIYEYLIE